MKFKEKILNFVQTIVLGSSNIKKLKKRGCTIGNNLWLGYGVNIDYTFCSLIKIGNNCTLTSNVRILAHDASTKTQLGYTKIGKVSIGDNVFIGVSSIVLPNVKIGDNVIIAAGSVVTKSVPSNEVWGGNPAKKICDIKDYLAKHSCDKIIRIDEWNDVKYRSEILDNLENSMFYIE